MWSQRWLRRAGVTGRTLVIAVPYLWLLLFFLIPFIIVLKICFSETQIALPPYQPLLDVDAASRCSRSSSIVGNFTVLVEDTALRGARISTR